MKVLILTSLFPNNIKPYWAPFNYQQIVHLAKCCDLRVVAPIPWIPPLISQSLLGKRAWAVEVTQRTKLNGLDVYHPRYFITPKVGRSLYWISYSISVFRKIRSIQQTFPFNLIYATWAYPDGFAAALLAKALKSPLVLKVHGSDINLLTRYPLRRWMITFALKQADGVVTVSQNLREKIINLGVAGNKIKTIYNGVNTDVFHPLNKKEARKRLGLPQKRKSSSLLEI